MEPGYISLYNSGELTKRRKYLFSLMESCTLCPRECKTSRFKNPDGFCHSGADAIVSSYCIHFGEEPPLTGEKGVGNIFFGNCNLRCMFCQNYQISQNWEHESKNTVTAEKLSDIMIELQNKGVSALGLVSGNHFLPQILFALEIAIEKGLNLPIIYNTNAYDKAETIRLLSGIIDIYLPDFKYGDDDLAMQYSKAKNYFLTASKSITEMFNQMGEKLTFGKDGLVKRGLIIRHLVLPNRISGAEPILKFLKEELSNKINLSIMSQYYPAHEAFTDELLNRSLRESEYEKAVSFLDKYGFENGWIQEFNSKDVYRPDFSNRITPFKIAI